VVLDRSNRLENALQSVQTQLLYLAQCVKPGRSVKTIGQIGPADPTNVKEQASCCFRFQRVRSPSSVEIPAISLQWELAK